MLSNILNNPLIAMLLTLMFFVLLLIMAKNEHITQNIDLSNNRMKFTIYEVKIVSWKNYNTVNFEAKAQKLENPFYSNYLYASNTQIYKNDKKNIGIIYLPSLEIYTNLYYGKAQNIKGIIYRKEKDKIDLSSPILIYSENLIIKNKKIELQKNYIYYKNRDNFIKIFYPIIEIYL